MSTTEPTRWLNAQEMRAWRAYIVGSALLEYQLHRDLHETHGLTLPDYEILVRLSEQPDDRMRMSLLAEDVAASKNRISHQISRMEKAGLVEREECPLDGRGIYAVLTPRGRAALEEAAPTHVESVRTHLIDRLTSEDLDVVAEVFDRVSTHLKRG